MALRPVSLCLAFLALPGVAAVRKHLLNGAAGAAESAEHASKQEGALVAIAWQRKVALLRTRGKAGLRIGAAANTSWVLASSAPVLPASLVRCIDPGDKLGEGSFGSVMGATCHQGDEEASANLTVTTQVALKTVSLGGEELKWLVNEAEIQSALKSPYVAQIFSYGLSYQKWPIRAKPNGLWIVMEQIPKGDFFDVFEQMNMPAVSIGDSPSAISRESKMPEFIAAIALSLFRGLAYLHEAKIIHRDIKLENVLFAKSGLCVRGIRFVCQVKLVDFGLACDLNSTDRHNCHELGGTLPYLSPKLLAFSLNKSTEYEAKFTDDIWAAGITLLTAWSIYDDRFPRSPLISGPWHNDKSNRIMYAFAQAYKPAKLDEWLKATNAPAALIKLFKAILTKGDDERATAVEAVALCEELWVEVYGRQAKLPSEPTASVPPETCSDCIEKAAGQSRKDACGSCPLPGQGGAPTFIPALIRRLFGCKCDR